MNAPKLLVSTVPAYLPEQASSIADNVSSFGTLYAASIRALSTKLFRLRFSRRAAIRNRFNKSVLRRNDVCFISIPVLIP